MTLNEYQEQAMTTCTESSNNDTYALFGLIAEVGELADKIAKAKRKELIAIEGDNIRLAAKIFFAPDKAEEATREIFQFRYGMKKELGDILWFVSQIARFNGWTLEDVAQTNLDKLAKRKAEGTIVDHEDH